MKILNFMFETNCSTQKFDISFILMRFSHDFFNCWCHRYNEDNKSSDRRTVTDAGCRTKTEKWKALGLQLLLLLRITHRLSHIPLINASDGVGQWSVLPISPIMLFKRFVVSIWSAVVSIFRWFGTISHARNTPAHQALPKWKCTTFAQFQLNFVSSECRCVPAISSPILQCLLNESDF